MRVRARRRRRRIAEDPAALSDRLARDPSGDTWSPYHRAHRSAADHEHTARAAIAALHQLRLAGCADIRDRRVYRLLEEVSIAAWQTSLQHEGFQACDDLALCRGIPDAVIDDARGHLAYYVEPISGCEFHLLAAPAGSLEDRKAPLTLAGVNASNWHGAAGPIRAGWNEGETSVVLVHESVLLKRSEDYWQPIALHRFAEYDDAFHLTRVSRPFVFLHRGTEVVLEMRTEGTETVVVTFAVDDHRAYACRIPYARVDAALNARRLTSTDRDAARMVTAD